MPALAPMPWALFAPRADFGNKLQVEPPPLAVSYLVRWQWCGRMIAAAYKESHVIRSTPNDSMVVTAVLQLLAMRLFSLRSIFFDKPLQSSLALGCNPAQLGC
jgi:hypothetical protein